MSRTFHPPLAVKGALELVRSSYDTLVTVPAMTVPVQRVTEALSVVTPYLLRIVGIKPVTEVGDSLEFREIILDPGMLSDRNLTTPLLKSKMLSVYGASMADSDILEYEKTLLLSYDNWSYDELFSAILPDNESLQSFTSIGHIVHVNLKDELLPYKYIMGQVLLDKVPTCRTVVNKIENIDNVYRNFEMELLAGEPDYAVSLKENSCTFQFEFHKVFWNSRLSTEHHRVYTKFKKGDTVYDACAGVGPFAIPAAKNKGARVVANDLNPDCTHFLKASATANNIPGDQVSVFNTDAQTFIRQTIRDDLAARSAALMFKDQPNHSTIPHATTPRSHLIANLPALAVTFLGSIFGVAANLSLEPSLVAAFYVHVYTFSKAVKPPADARRQVEFYLGSGIEDVEAKVVRNVAPNKVMCRVSFRVPADVLLGNSAQPPDPSTPYECSDPILPKSHKREKRKASGDTNPDSSGSAKKKMPSTPDVEPHRLAAENMAPL